MHNQKELNFIRILKDNKDQIYRICRIYAVSPLEPQDLFQEVVIQIWRSLSNFKGNSSISTWIYKIALNVCYRSNEKSNRTKNKMVRLESIKYLATENTNELIQKEKYQALHNCINSLNEIDKSIIVLYLEELPYKEIALITDLTENHIAVKMKRIKKTLLNCIVKKLK